MEEREERANEPEDRTVEINLNNREKQAGKKKKRTVSENCGSITRANIPAIGDPK